MTLLGYTTESQPTRVFSADELLQWLASPANTSDFTYAMGYLMVKGYRGDDAFSATSITGTCPREFRLKQDRPYTLSLEQGQFAIDGTFFHAMVEMTPEPEGFKGFREKRFAKRVVLGRGSNRKEFILPGRMDEVVLDYKNGQALIRDYKRTKSVPKYGSPWPTHKKQLNIYRWMLSDIDGKPIQLRDGIEFWQATPDDWIEVDPIDVGYGEVVYRSMEAVKRVQIGADQRVNFDDIEDVSAWIKKTMPHYVDMDRPMVTMSNARSEDGFGFGWKCNYCPVKTQCEIHFAENEQVFDQQRAISELVQAGFSVSAPNVGSPAKIHDF